MVIRSGIGIAALAACLLPAFASGQERLSRECRAEVRQICPQTGDGKRIACIAEKSAQASAPCQAQIATSLKALRGQPAKDATPVTTRAARWRPTPEQVISYGDHQRQGIDYYAPSKAIEKPPLILFVHGGGWQIGSREGAVHAKAAHFSKNGYAFGSVGYRLLPEAPVETQAQDVADGLAAMRKQADKLGFDPNNIVLMGHSAGAHLAALVATDPQYAGKNFGAITGVVLLDGAGYDVPTQMAGRPAIPEIYSRAFGDDPARQKALSPFWQVSKGDAPDWLILYVGRRADSRAQSQALAEKLVANGSAAQAVGIPNTDHGTLNRELGKPDDPATAKVDAFVSRIAALP